MCHGLYTPACRIMWWVGAVVVGAVLLLCVSCNVYGIRTNVLLGLHERYTYFHHTHPFFVEEHRHLISSSYLYSKTKQLTEQATTTITYCRDFSKNMRTLATAARTRLPRVHLFISKLHHIVPSWPFCVERRNMEMEERRRAERQTGGAPSAAAASRQMLQAVSSSTELLSELL